MSENVTERLAETISQRSWDDLSIDEATVARQCLLDYIGVAIAGRDEPLVRILCEQALAEGGHPQASVIAMDHKVTLAQASLINGAAGHAHDYDDVHMAMSGHPTVPVAPALLALAEHHKKPGTALIQAFVAGFDTECILGRYLGGSHYARGFHATGTLGCFGAAAACANLLELDARATAHVLGIAATQAAGLKSMFGTMSKPLHAGKAAQNGLLAAQLGARGFTSETRSVEIEQGFAATHGDSPSLEAFDEALATRHVPDTLFKYHAACYLTHSAMEGTRFLLSEHGLTPDVVKAVNLVVDEGHLAVCNIRSPETGLEAKFSLRFTTAMILHGIDTTNVGAYTDELTSKPELNATRDKVSVSPGYAYIART